MTRPVTILTQVPAGLLSRVGARFPKAEVVQVPGQGPLAPEVRGEVLLTFTWGSENLGAVMERGVRWVHAYGTGVDGFPFDALGSATLTCSRGASAVPIAEWVLAVMLAFEKRLPEAWVTEPPAVWSTGLALGGLSGKTLGLLGLGGIGIAVARRALSFGMRVVATRRSGTDSPLDGVEVAPLDEVLASADHLVVAAPATPETRGLLSADAFARMKQSVHLVNVARGELVDQDALRDALDGGRVARASLDVAVPEPLPAGHWLYRHPRVRLSAHISWSGPGALDDLLDPFLENLARYLDGVPPERLANRVDRALGY